jgi:hypothetical protein
VVRRPQVELVADPVELGDRRFLERHVAPLEDRARVHHRVVEHQLEEVVAEVVVGGDVIPRAQRRVAGEQPLGALVGPAHRRDAAAELVDPVQVASGDLDHGGDVGRIPPAVAVGLREPLAAAPQRRPDPRVADDDGRLR